MTPEREDDDMGTATWAAGPTEFSWKRSSALGTTLALHAFALALMLAPPAAVEIVRKQDEQKLTVVEHPVEKIKPIPVLDPPTHKPPAVRQTQPKPPQPQPQTTSPPIDAPVSPMSTPVDEGTATPTTSAVVESGPIAPGYGKVGRIAYPREALKRRQEGKVTLRVLVGIDGVPQQVDIETSSGSIYLDRAARDAVAKWRFTPGMRNGVPYATWGLVPVDFHLNDL